MAKKSKSIHQYQKETYFSFYITDSRGIKYNREALDNISKQLEEKSIQTNWEVKKFDPFNLSDETKKKIETIEIRLKSSSWKSTQRSLRKKGKLDQYKIDALNKLGMVWNPKEDEWEKNYLLFRKRGFCYRLEDWIKDQRKLYELGQINIENFHRLQAINFPFDKEKIEQFPMTDTCFYEIKNIYFNEWYNEYLKNNKREVESEEAIIENTIRLKIDQIRSSFVRDLYKFSYEESISLIDRVIEGENIFRDDFLIAKHTQKIIDKKGLKGKFGNPKYYDSESSTEKLDDYIFYKILKYFNPKDNEKLDDSLICGYLANFNKNRIKPMVRKYCCEKMLNFFEVVGNDKMRSFAPLDYLISYYESEKDIDELQKLKKYTEKYPLLSILYKDKIDGILSKI